MYCKYCGKQLSNNARFCDRCGHNVGKASSNSSSRSSASGSRSIYGQNNSYNYEKNRSGGNDKYQKYKREQARKAAEEKRRKIRNRRIILVIILLAVIASVATGVGSYIYVKNHSDETWKNTDGAAQVNSTASVSPSVSPQPSASADSTPAGSQGTDSILSSAAENKCKIYTDKTMNFTFPYPEAFVEASISGSKTKYSVKDPNGDGSMMISAETISSSTTAKQIMKDYASGVGTSLSFNRAGDNWYSLAFERNGKYNYRKGIILNGQHIYYDFVYESSTAKRSEYDGYIKYIDEYTSALLEKGSAAPAASSSAKASKTSQEPGSAKASSSSTAKATAKATSSASSKNTQE